MKHYHNTVPESDNLKQYETKAKRQDEKILDYFKCRPDQQFTPADIHKWFDDWPITSVRRAITNLTDQGHLIKTDIKRIGGYGRTNCTWKYKQPEDEKQLRLL